MERRESEWLTHSCFALLGKQAVAHGFRSSPAGMSRAISTTRLWKKTSWDCVPQVQEPGPPAPTLFTIYCDSDLQPFVDVLDSGHYASLSHGWLFNTEVQCDRAKRARYLGRRRFKFRRTRDG